MRIAVVDDDEATVKYVSQLLMQSGHACVTFKKSQDLITALGRDTFDLMVLDWNMPGLSGMDILDWARANLAQGPPAIMLTNRADKDDIAAALNAGADDYIIKPETPAVIVARVEAVLRRARPRPTIDRFVQIGIYHFDLIGETISVAGVPVAFTAREFKLAWMLFSNLDRPLSRAWLMEMVWKSAADLSTRTLDMHVSRIRAKLQLRAENGYRLHTIFGFGYRLETL